MLAEKRSLSCTMLVSWCRWLSELELLLNFQLLLYCALVESTQVRMQRQGKTCSKLTCLMRAFLACCAGMTKPSAVSLLSCMSSHMQVKLSHRCSLVAIAKGALCCHRDVLADKPRAWRQKLLIGVILSQDWSLQYYSTLSCHPVGFSDQRQEQDTALPRYDFDTST